MVIERDEVSEQEWDALRETVRLLILVFEGSNDPVANKVVAEARRSIRIMERDAPRI